MPMRTPSSGARALPSLTTRMTILVLRVGVLPDGARQRVIIAFSRMMTSGLHWLGAGWRDQADVALRAAAVPRPVASSLMPPHATPHRPDLASGVGIPSRHATPCARDGAGLDGAAETCYTITAMKSSYRSQYGPPEVLSVVEALVPVAKDDELLIRVRAATVNRTDCAILLGQPFVMRFFCGLLKPKHAATGCDFAGEVHAIGKSVTRFKVGDRVWGFDDQGLGSHSQYLTLSQSKAMAEVPDGISFEQAAASAEGAHYALNFLNKLALQPGHMVMLNGATGAIGSALLQLIKHQGAHVTATCATAHIERIRALGADRVIDYSVDDFTQDPARYDVVFDAVGKSTFDRCRALLKPRGVYISSELGPYLQNPLLALVTPLLGGKKVAFPLPFNPQASLDFIKGLLAKQAFSPLIDRTFPLERIQDAFKLTLSGEKIGNVVLTLD